MADPAAFLASKQCSGTLFASENSLPIHFVNNKYVYLNLNNYLIDIENIKIKNVYSSKTTQTLPLNPTFLCMYDEIV